jgi:adenine-specific DNA-methyltransferase
LRIIKRIGMEIIEFLAQIENFQKMLWEKKKFVTETFYCITVGNIPEDFYPEIAQCEAQWEEWKTLYHIHEESDGLLTADLETPEGRIEFLKAHPTLVLDTRHFPPDFTDRLLAHFENLDDAIDGLLIHSENWQALNLLQERYRGQVKCIYIDPPYNTGNDGFIYRDQFRHSSWLAMMENRLRLAYDFLNDDGVAFVHIDENEQPRLYMLLNSIFGEENHLAPLIWLSRAGKGGTATKIQIGHEQIESFAKHLTKLSLKPIERIVEDCPYEDEKGRYKRELLRQWGGQHDRREDRPTLYFPIPTPFGIEVYPKRPDGADGTWRFSRKKVMEMLEEGELEFVRNEETGEITVYRKIRAGQKSVSVPGNLFDDVGSSADGTKTIQALFGQKVFDTTKPVPLAERLVGLVSWQSPDKDTVLDFFAGSGTTGHAVINLNREDGGRRKFILVEMAEYFDTVLLPRLKKVIFTPEWKEGKPKRMATDEEAKRSPRILKIIRLESYEDALNNLTFDEASGQKMLERFGDEYLLRYMLVWETRRSETLLNVEKLAAPFCYKLKIHRDGETQERTVDLPETFNYLLGLEVQRRFVHDDNGRRYLIYRGALPDKRTAVVIWRDIQGCTRDDFQREAKLVTKQGWTQGADEVYVNGDSSIPNAQSLDDIFKRRLFAPVEA